MIADQQVVGEKVAEAAERGRASKLMPILLAKQGQYGGFQQGIGRQVSARMQGARHGRVAAHRAQHAHLLRGWPGMAGDGVGWRGTEPGRWG